MAALFTVAKIRKQPAGLPHLTSKPLWGGHSCYLLFADEDPGSQRLGACPEQAGTGAPGGSRRSLHPPEGPSPVIRRLGAAHVVPSDGSRVPGDPAPPGCPVGRSLSPPARPGPGTQPAFRGPPRPFLGLSAGGLPPRLGTSLTPLTRGGVGWRTGMRPFSVLNRLRP